MITTALADPAEEANTVAEYAERYPGAVSPIVLSLASKFDEFRPGYYWFGVYLLCVRLLAYGRGGARGGAISRANLYTGERGDLEPGSTARGSFC